MIDKKIALLFDGRKKLSGKRIEGLIVSLTSFPERIEEIKYAIYSLLDQTFLPEKIILWLAESQFPNEEQDLPKELLIFRNFGLVINWCEDIKSYKKLIPALEQYPDYYIVTADDDLYYHKKWLEKLWIEHKKYPKDLVCHYVFKISFSNKNVLPYTQWRICRKREASFRIFCCSGGGILFHKKYLHEDIGRVDLFLDLSPHADDIWFYFMAVMNGTKIRIVGNPYIRLKYIDPYREYGLSEKYRLSAINVDNDLNDRQFKNMMEHYNIDLYSLLNSK